MRAPSMEYVKAICAIHYKQFDKKKMSKAVFEKELKAAIDYGNIESLQNLYNKVDDTITKDELVGEIQTMLTESYMKTRKLLKLKTKRLDVEDFINKTEFREVSCV